MTTSPNKKVKSAVNPLVPAEFAYIFDQKPVLWCESETLYAQVLAGYLSQLKPTTFLEYRWTKNITDIEWDIMRYQRLQTAGLIAEMPDATRNFLGYEFSQIAQKLGMDGGDQMLIRAIRLAANGNPWAQEKADRLVDLAFITHDTLLYKSYTAHGNVQGDLTGIILRLEQRRDELIKRFEDRRRSLASHRNSLIDENQQDKVVEVDPSSSDDQGT